MSVPKYDELFNPLLRALRELGSSASVAELEDRVASLLQLSEEDVTTIHKGNRTRLSYNLAWARTYLKKFGLVDNSSRGVWSLTPKGQQTDKVDPDEVKRFVVARNREETLASEDESEELLASEELTWEDDALEAIKGMPAESFERLCQRLLRESGFIQVEITGRSGDGGIDGRGVVKLGQIISFHVHFQCKRYRDSISSPLIRDFRGAMVGRADKGIFITTGSFTRDARQEALRDGAPPLDLIDGDDLVKMLKTFRLGVTVREKIVEEVSVDKRWFETF
ncbi:MAG: restriction endonuclease [Verrucomicrobia bacterium]|nr:MAG: restriction endonuclease [Verrucomicrobiota bacterium]TMP91566.1 MAG: restriction endonuclease [Verrucomicrobiota bacterium]